jgi:hypothetical protein
MKLRTRGLLVEGIDHGLYVSRPTVESALLAPVLSGGNVLLLGPSGAGKTTALHKLAADLRAHDVPAVIVNASLAESSADLLELAADALGATLMVPRPNGLAILAAISRLGGVPPSALLIDGPLPDGGRELFGRYRDELWKLEHRWVLASSPNQASAVRVPPADAFWDQVITLPPFSELQAAELLERGLDGSEQQFLLDGGWQPPEPAWPRAIVRSVRDSLTESTPLRAPDEVKELHERQAALPRVPAMVLAELTALRRPAAASDQELLLRLGYSRAYVARALVELEDLGLVVASVESSPSKTGRPRKLYEPTLPEL